MNRTTARKVMGHTAKELTARSAGGDALPGTLMILRLSVHLGLALPQHIITS
jgi:hypothetical protein